MAAIPEQLLPPEGVLAAEPEADPEADRWDQARAAFARGWQLEGDGRFDAATTAYQLALRWVRELLPVHGATRHHRAAAMMQAMPALGSMLDLHLDRRRWLVLRSALGLRRVAPDLPDPLRGELQLTLRADESLAAELPSDLRFDLELYLVPVEGSSPPSEEAGQRAAMIRCGADAAGVARIDVLPGRYALIPVRATVFTGPEIRERLGHFLEFDFGAWPEFVEVGDRPLSLPEVRVWRHHEILLRQPAPRTEVSEDSVFQWSAVPQAAYYEVVLDKTLEGIRYPPLEVRQRSETAELRLADQPALLQTMRQKNHDYWTVEAFDADGRRIGRTSSADEKRLFSLRER